MSRLCSTAPRVCRYEINDGRAGNDVVEWSEPSLILPRPAYREVGHESSFILPFSRSACLLCASVRRWSRCVTLSFEIVFVWRCFASKIRIFMVEHTLMQGLQIEIEGDASSRRGRCRSLRCCRSDVRSSRRQRRQRLRRWGGAFFKRTVVRRDPQLRRQLRFCMEQIKTL